MTDIRKFIDLFAPTAKNPARQALNESAKLREFAADADDILDEDPKLKGTLDPRAVAKLLPEIDDENRFITAVKKVQKGDDAALTVLEIRQLAAAFISLLRDDSQTKMKVFQRLRLVSSEDSEV